MERTLYYKIANRSFSIQGNHSIDVFNVLDGFPPFVENVGRPSFSLSLDTSITLRSFKQLYACENEFLSFRFGSAGTQSSMALLFQSGASLFFDMGEPNNLKASSFSSPNELRFAVWTAFSLSALFSPLSTSACADTDIAAISLPIHSSVVVFDNRAVIFLGESGTGKSTHSRLWTRWIEGSSLLNDDSPILFFLDGSLYVSGSPWSGKTPCYRNESFPVMAFVRLEQCVENHIALLDAMHSFAALQPSFSPLLVSEKECRSRLLRWVAALAQRIPVYRLLCRPDADAAFLSFNTLFG